MTPGDALDGAFEACPRVAFLPAAQRRYAGLDGPLPIGWGQTNSQPRTVRRMLELLDVRAGHRVLDVGSGSAWTTALLAHLVGPAGEVVGVEIVPSLVEIGRRNVARHPPARVEPAVPDVLGLPDLAPFDRILVSAEATASAVARRAARRGRRARRTGRGSVHEVRRRGDEAVDVRHGHYAFVPLVGG